MFYGDDNLCKKNEDNSKIKETFLSKYPKWSIVIFGLIIIAFPIILGVAMALPISNLNNGSNESWLGFWGGYLGSIIAICGVGWTVFEGRQNLNKSIDEQQKNLNKSIKKQQENLDRSIKEQREEMQESFDKQSDIQKKNAKDEKEGQFRIARPFFVIRGVIHEINIGDIYCMSDRYLNSPILLKKLIEQLEIKEITNTIEIKNLSNKKMMAINICVYDSDKKDAKPAEHFKIDKLNKDETIQLLPPMSENMAWSRLDDDGKGLVKQSPAYYAGELNYSFFEDGKKYSKMMNERPTVVIDHIEIYFMTELREKIMLLFRFKNHVYEYTSKVLENKDDSEKTKVFDSNYKIDNFQRTPIVQIKKIDGKPLVVEI